MAYTDLLSTISHNTTGWSESKASIINTLLVTLNISVFALQEHMKLKANLHQIQSKFHNHEIFSIPAFKTSEYISQGRPSGGLSLG